MSMRKYNGSPIDMTWSNGPWANDGETVDATDGDTGTMTTIDWPEGATPREELNEDQIAVIEAAARNRDIDSPTKLNELAGLTDKRSRAYSGCVLRSHWEDRYWVEDDDASSIELPNGKAERAELARKLVLDGKSVPEVAADFGLTDRPVRDMLRGSRGYSSVDIETPPLKYIGSPPSGEWVVSTEDSRLPLDHVEKVRSRILDGEKIYQIAGDYDVGANEVYKAVAGLGKYESVNAPTPPLESDGSGLDSEWYVPESETETDTEQEKAEQTEPETEPTLDGQSVSKGYTPREPTTTDNTKRNVVIATVALLISYLLGKRGGN